MSPNSSPKLATLRGDSPRYMKPTMSSKARARGAASPEHPKSPSKLGDGRRLSAQDTQPSAPEVTAVTDAQGHQKLFSRRGLAELLRPVEHKQNSSTTTIKASNAASATKDRSSPSIAGAPTTPAGPVAPVAPMNPITPHTYQKDNKGTLSVASPPTSKPSKAKSVAYTADQGAVNITSPTVSPPGGCHAPEKTTKRRQSEDDEEAAIASRITERSSPNKKVSFDNKPVAKKRKTESVAPGDLVLLDSESDDDDVVAPLGKRKRATDIESRQGPATGKKAKTTPKHEPSELDRLIAKEEKRKAATTGHSVFARNAKLKRSFRDTMTAARNSRAPPLVHTQGTAIASAREAARVRQAPAMDSSTAVHAPGTITYDQDDPNVVHADLRKIKFISVTSNTLNVSIDRIIENPAAYPNVNIEFKDGRPHMAHITKMSPEEFEVACKAAANREKDQRKLDNLLARKNKFGASKPSLRKVAKGKVTRQPRKARKDA